MKRRTFWVGGWVGGWLTYSLVEVGDEGVEEVGFSHHVTVEDDEELARGPFIQDGVVEVAGLKRGKKEKERVGGWFDWVEKEQGVTMRCCGLLVGGWVGR